MSTHEAKWNRAKVNADKDDERTGFFELPLRTLVAKGRPLTAKASFERPWHPFGCRTGSSEGSTGSSSHFEHSAALGQARAAISSILPLRGRSSREPRRRAGLSDHCKVRLRSPGQALCRLRHLRGLDKLKYSYALPGLGAHDSLPFPPRLRPPSPPSPHTPTCKNTIVIHLESVSGGVDFSTDSFVVSPGPIPPNTFFTLIWWYLVA